MKHQLVIHSLHDGKADCICGFHYACTGPATEEEIKKLHDSLTDER